MIKAEGRRQTAPQKRSGAMSEKEIERIIQEEPDEEKVEQAIQVYLKGAE